MRARSELFTPKASRVLALLVLACTGSRGASLTPRETPVSAFVDPMHAGLQSAPEPRRLTLFVREGRMRNYFLRQGHVAAHLITRSGSEPRIITALPAENQG